MSQFKEEVNKTVKVLKEGGLILYPTDTVWGIGCDATNPKAVEKVFQLKKRTDNKSFVILVANESMLIRHVKEVPEIAWKLIDCADKPFTIIYPHAQNIASNAIGLDKSVAIRIVHHAFCKQVIEKLRKPIVSTSANISGVKTPKKFHEIHADILQGVNLVVDLPKEELTGTNSPSSIIKIEVNGQFKIIR